MVRTTSTISIFLASPSDVSDEREVVSTAIETWNRTRGRERSTYFELLRWETNVSAGFGSDGQQVINNQIGSEYDVLIALFWTRIGSATPRSTSGTTEEYERALNRFINNESVEIAFYFKDAPVPLDMINPEQIQGVRNLQERISNEGALYKKFKDDNNLRFEIDLLLDRLSREMLNDGHAARHSAPVAAQALTNENTVLSEKIERGIIDIGEDLEKHSHDSGEFLDEMTILLNELSQETDEVTQELAELGRLGALTASNQRPLIDRISSNMNKFSDFLEKKAPLFADNTIAVAEDTRDLIDVSHDFSTTEDEIEIFRMQLSGLLSSMDESTQSLEGLMRSTQELQRMTRSFNAARKRLVANLSMVISATNSSRSILREAVKEIDTLGAKTNNGDALIVIGTNELRDQSS